ncbi:ornithine cyclodeaminase family protein [Halorubrum sp. N11]|uniref:ornithine cyclodeaminase family protein n=1 Tax=Halorubrum sp. N11 TaxID=3402276 RepID=UPI003EB7FD4F
MVGTSLLSQSDVEDALDVADALRVVERTYIETNRDRVVNPAKLSMHLGDDGGWPDYNAFAINMPAYVDWLDAVGTKWAVATWDADVEDPISSLILLFDLDGGRFEAILEGMYLTGVRTALQSAVGLKHLLPDTPESVGVFGAGFQAAFQLSVTDELLDINEFFLYDISRDKADGLAAEMRDQLDAELTVCETAATAARNDAVLTVTDSKLPVLDAEWPSKAGLIVALGSYQELPDEILTGADRLVVDHVEQCLQRGALADIAARDGLSASDLDATIGEVLDDERETPVRPSDRTVFVPIGLGALDIALAKGVYNNMISDSSVEFDFN